MSDVSFDFYMHVLLMVYKEMVKKRIETKERELPDEFWEQ